MLQVEAEFLYARFQCQTQDNQPWAEQWIHVANMELCIPLYRTQAGSFHYLFFNSNDTETHFLLYKNLI